ncbi:MAG TPA: fumarylacetoacetate hydrolase family protein, partial [Acidimicrobiia bacterium]
MRFATFRAPGSPIERVGVADGERVCALAPGVALVDLLGDLAEAGRAALASPDTVFGLAEVRLLAPIPVPPSVRDFYAFEAHVRTARATRGLEVDPDWYELPVFY